MILPDVNVLLYAFRSDSREHHRYKEWLENVVNGPSAYGISPQVLASVVRIATHPRIFIQPSSLESVLEFAGALLAPPHCNIIHPGVRHWGHFSQRFPPIACRWKSGPGCLVRRTRPGVGM